MQINPEFEKFSQIEEIEKMKEIMKDGENSVLAEGSKEELEKLQNDLRKVGYEEIFINTDRIVP